MQGRQMRCKNAVCRTIFEVRGPAGEPAEASTYPVLPAPERGSWTGQVGDMIPFLEAEPVADVPEPPPAVEPGRSSGHVQDVVPFLPAEPVEAVAPEAPREAPSWQQPPPVRRRPADATENRPQPEPAATDAAPRKSKKAPKTMTAVPPGPLDLPPESPTTSPDPRVDFAAVPEPPAPADWVPAVPEHDGHDAYAASARRRSLWVISGLVGLAIALIGGGALIAWNMLVQTEGSLSAQAQAAYEEGNFTLAASKFENLFQDFPQSEHRQRYQFLQQFSAIRKQIYSPIELQPEEASEKLDFFLREHNDTALLKERRGEVRETLARLAEGFTALADQKQDRQLLARARDALKRAEEFGQLADNVRKSIQGKIAQAEAGIVRQEAVERLVKEGGALADRPTSEAVHQFRELAQTLQVDREAKVREVLVRLEEAVRRRVRWIDERTDPVTSDVDDQEPTLLVAPRLDGDKTLPAANDRVFLAVARGVLHGLSQSNGEVLWATRVGIDTTSVPVLLARSPAFLEEILLVVSADRNTLRALNAQSGRQLWQHQFSSPCLGRPLVVRRRAYVPTYDGKVHEIEVIEGTRLGYFELGQPLTVGGAWQQGTDLLYFPGDSRNVYVLSIAENQKGCVAILRSGHPSGSLRSEPIIINRDPQSRSAWPPFLILSQADGLSHMKLRVFQLPIENSDAVPVLQPEPRVPGWSWFQPYHDSDKLAFASDAGVLGLFGINQVLNQDRPLFPELPGDYHLGGNTDRPRRAQVVHAGENDFWVLANDQLRRLYFEKFRQEMHQLWEVPSLGAPLHAGQLDEDGQTLFVATQAAQQGRCLATAVEAQRGRIAWQRQLGLECQGDPVVLGNEVLVIDRGGSLFRFDAGEERRGLEGKWQIGGDLLAGPLEEGPIAPLLLAAGDGMMAYEVACPGRGKQLIVRTYRAGRGGESARVHQNTVSLLHPLAGTPAVTPEGLILPLADGSLLRLRLPLDGGSGEGGPHWRSPRADEGAPGHVVAFRAGEILVTDGSNGLSRRRWGRGPAEFGLAGEVPLPARIVAAPVVLTPADPDAEPRVCVADALGGLTLLQGAELKVMRRWHLGEKVTAGPFLRGGRVGWIVDRNRLAWLDPARPQLLWEFTLPGKEDAEIVGQPQLVGDQLLIVDQSGRFFSLDPATGQPRGPAYRLKASVVPTATPVAFGAEQAFVPLSDGTVFLLPLRGWRELFREWPVIW
jgi:outer membrane protein assembly factor BamB